MFKVLIGLEESARSESLSEACQLFIQKIQERISAGGMSQIALYETCMIVTKFDGVEFVMNFHSIAELSHAIGILTERGALINKPAPHIHKDIERQVFIAASNKSLTAYLEECNEELARIVLGNEAEPEQPAIIIATR